MFSALPSAPVPLLAPSLNLAKVSPLTCGIALVVLVLFFLARLLLFPSRKKPLSLTELNTLLNRHENGGTGVWARKLRRALFPPTKWGDEDELEGAGISDSDEGEGKEGEMNGWTVRSTPVPSGLRSCLKKVEQFEAALRSAVDAVAEAAEENAPSSPSPPPSSSPAPSISSRTASPAPPKRVRIVEPLMDEVEALRELWASPEMQGEGGNGGIGGYRRTRDFYSKSQGGKAVIKGGKEDKDGEGKKDEKEKTRPAPISVAKAASSAVKSDDSSSPTSPTRRSSGPRLTLPPGAAPFPAANRSASHSPSPHTRRPAHTRTLSPSKLGISAQRRRALSPSGTTGGARSASLPPALDKAGNPASAPAPASAVPRWVKTRGGRIASPAPVARRAGSNSGSSTGSRDDEQEEEEEEVEQFDDVSSPSSPSSPLFSITAESEAGDTSLNSPTPSLISTQNLPPISTSAASRKSITSPTSPPPSVVVSPSTPPGKTIDLPLLDALPPAAPAAPALPPSPDSTSPTPTTTSISPSTATSASTTTNSTSNSTSASSASSRSPSPSPCVQKERRLSLRVQQALGSKKERQLAAGRQAVEA